jgi:hypothetical protein
MPEEIAPDIDNSDIPFETAGDRVLFDNQTLQLDVETLKKMRGDYGEYWELKARLAAPATDTLSNNHAAGFGVTFLLNVPGKDASEGQWRAYLARLGELQVQGMGLAKPDRAVSPKGVEGKRIGAMVGVYTNPTSGNQKQQVNRFVKAS